MFKNFSTWLIITATVALVSLPVLTNQFTAELARWDIAAAANAATLQSGSPEPYLQRALQRDPDASKLRDYWLLRIKLAIVSEPETVSELIEQAIAADPNHISLVSYAAQLLWNVGEWHEQIEVLELVRNSPNHKLSDEALNQLAYSRALVVLDLDQALSDIEQVLKKEPNNPAYRDTRAWILFRMQRLEEALVDVDFAVKRIDFLQEGDYAARALDFLLGWTTEVRENTNATPEPKNDRVLTRAEAGEALWGMGALHYHRGRILQELGRNDEAQADWNWLSEHQLPADDSLF